MTSHQIRQSFLDFFKSKQHTIVPSSSLMPDSPGLLFTNAGMNQFVPIFLNQRKPDVSKWAGAIPGLDTRAADTQKCIRAGGKHNDLEDVGLDTYHHTFFEMLGNWSFGDYFKREAIDWAWELVAEIWKFPKDRLYATVYNPDKSKGDPSELDQEAWDFWAEKFRAAGLDPKVHIVYGNKKDNFWMMGDTGPCGPCSEIHVDLTPQGDTKGALVNKGDARCIEIWNLVFIQFTANPDGAFSPLPAKHVDTGMGFERVTSIMQGTKGFTDFANAKISNYETDIFRPIFDKLEQLSGRKYGSTLPSQESEIPNLKSQIATDVAFRVIGDHIRTLSFAIADGIQPGNTDRNYVLRRIHRRMVRYAKTINVEGEVLLRAQDELVETLARTMGDVFPEVRARKEHIKEVLRREADAFNKTLDKGIEIFENAIRELAIVRDFLTAVPNSIKEIRNELRSIPDTFPIPIEELEAVWAGFDTDVEGALRRMAVELAKESILNGGSCRPVGILLNWANRIYEYCQHTSEVFSRFEATQDAPRQFEDCRASVLRELDRFEARVPNLLVELGCFPGDNAFKLYDTYGFPLDLTELMARERGLTVDTVGFDKLMEEQRDRARKAQKKQVIEISQLETTAPTKFIGYDNLETTTKVLEVVSLKDKIAVILDASACYAEMGGQVGDAGEIVAASVSLRSDASTAPSQPQLRWRVVNTQKSGNTWLHLLGSEISNSESQIADVPAVGSTVTLSVDIPRRNAIQRHHTVTHLFHWALHEVVSKDATQKGSYVGPEKLTFDFNSAPLTPQQIADIEKLVNERILENAGVSWTEIPYADVKGRKDVLQFFGDKYGDVVRVVQIGGKPKDLDGYSMELCGGTHTRATGEIGLFRIVGESAIAAGVRRIEAVAGLQAYQKANEELQLIKAVASKVNSPVGELEKKIEALLTQQKELEKQLKSMQQKEAANTARGLVAKAQVIGSQTAPSQAQLRAIVENLGVADGDYLQAVADALKSQFKGVIVLGGVNNGAVALVAAVTPEFTSKVQAGKIIQAIAPIVGGKGGGKPDNARGGGKDASKLDEALAKAKGLLASTPA